jgi:hypothetical protein
VSVPLRVGRPELRLLGRTLRSWRQRPGQPWKLTWAVTWACQSGCQLCSIWKRTPKNELTVAEARQLFRQAPGFGWVDLTGGEPFLRDDLPELGAAVVEECRDLALLHLPTNGLDPQRVEDGVRALLELPVRRLVMTVSADGPPERNLQLRGHPEAWSGAMDTLQRLRTLRSDRFAVYLGVTLSEHNADVAHDVLGAVQAEIRGFDPADLHWNLAQGSEHYYDNVDAIDELPAADLLPVLESVAPARPGLRQLADPVGWLDQAWRVYARRFVVDQRTPVRCRALWSSAFLDPEGRLFPCITWDRPVGSLRDHAMDLRRLWATGEVRAAAADAGAGRCPQCWTACDGVPALLSSPPALATALGEGVLWYGPRRWAAGTN